MQDFSKKSSDLRRQHNADLIRRMRGGDPLNAFDSKASWFPPRPIIQKDRSEMARVYSDAGQQESSGGNLRRVRDRRVVALPTAQGGDGDDHGPLDEAG